MQAYLLWTSPARCFFSSLILRHTNSLAFKLIQVEKKNDGAFPLAG
jgi:hypothetical protein